MPFLAFHIHLTIMVQAAYFRVSSIGNRLRSSEVNGVRHDIFLSQFLHYQ